MDTTMQVGGWVLNPQLKPIDVPEEAVKVFREAFDGWVGSCMEPVLYCGSQLVHGTLHLYVVRITQSFPPHFKPINHLQTLVVHQPLPTEKDEKCRPLFDHPLSKDLF